jgi:tetratricopeptide (TPR) repeat protein
MARVLLVYANPAVTAMPVPPLGMERVAQVFELAGCDVRLLAPFVEADAGADLQAALQDGPWDLVGFSIRNIDDALVVRSVVGDGPIDTCFYLDKVRPLVQQALASVGASRVLIGGPALSTGPLPVLRYLGAPLGVSGPADDLVWHLGKALAAGNGLVLLDDPRVVRVETPSSQPHASDQPRDFTQPIEIFPAPARRMGPYLGLTLDRGARVPVVVAAGCNRRCHFCVEARFVGRQIKQRPIEAIAVEIQQLQALGATRFWLATSELNVPDDRFAIALLKRLAPLKVDLGFFVVAAPVSDAFLDACEDAGVDPTTLSYEFGHFDDALLRKGAGPANRRHIDALVETYLRRGYRTLGGSALFGAHQDEDWDSIGRAVDAIRAIDAALPDGLGLAYATGARVYPQTDLADWVGANPELARPDLYGANDPSFVEPVIFSRPAAPRALLAHLQTQLAPCRGPMGPMNAEAPASVEVLATEALVNRGIYRRHQDRATEAAALFREALQRDPEHLEALAQLSTTCSNDLGLQIEARSTLSRLTRLLRADDPRLASVEIAIGKL